MMEAESTYTIGRATIRRIGYLLYELLWDEAKICEGSLDYVCNYYNAEFWKDE